MTWGLTRRRPQPRMSARAACRGSGETAPAPALESKPLPPTPACSFERNDFDAIAQTGDRTQARGRRQTGPPRAAASAAPRRCRRRPSRARPRSTSLSRRLQPARGATARKPAPSGLVLTPLKLVLLALLVLFGLGLAFAGGLLLGLFLGK